jgi:hypothetical protein
MGPISDFLIRFFIFAFLKVCPPPVQKGERHVGTPINRFKITGLRGFGRSAKSF